MRSRLQPRCCSREGCLQPVATDKPGNRFCSFSCRAINYELLDARRVCEAVGPCSTAAGELWAAAVAVSDALSEYQRLDRKLQDLARSIGITPEQWHGLKRLEKDKPTMTRLAAQLSR